MSDRIGEFMRSYWAAIAGALVVAAGWGTSTAQLASLQREQASGQAMIASKIDRLTDSVGEVKENLAGVKARGDYAISDIADLRQRLMEIEKRR